MCDILQVNREIAHFLPKPGKRTLVFITGARQTGKTTLVKQCFPGLSYYNLDAIEYRDQLSSISTFSWAKDVGYLD